MTPRAFVAAVRSGRILMGQGGLAAGETLADGVAPLSAADADAVTAEAFNQDVFDPETPWETARALIAGLLLDREGP